MHNKEQFEKEVLALGLKGETSFCYDEPGEHSAWIYINEFASLHIEKVHGIWHDELQDCPEYFTYLALVKYSGEYDRNIDHVFDGYSENSLKEAMDSLMLDVKKFNDRSAEWQNAIKSVEDCVIFTI